MSDDATGTHILERNCQVVQFERRRMGTGHILHGEKGLSARSFPGADAVVQTQDPERARKMEEIWERFCNLKLKYKDMVQKVQPVLGQLKEVLPTASQEEFMQHMAATPELFNVEKWGDLPLGLISDKVDSLHQFFSQVIVDLTRYARRTGEGPSVGMKRQGLDAARTSGCFRGKRRRLQ